jgi:SnoaL-like protein
MTRRAGCRGICIQVYEYVTIRADAAVADESEADVPDQIQPPPEIRDRIRDLFALYAWSFDTADLERYVGTFTEHGVLDLPDDRYTGHAEIRAYAAGVIADPNFVGRQHFVGQSLFSPSATGWMIRSYAMITSNATGAAPTIMSLGHYLDECVESKSGWLFARRTYRRWGGDVLARFAAAQSR